MLRLYEPMLFLPSVVTQTFPDLASRWALASVASGASFAGPESRKQEKEKKRRVMLRCLGCLWAPQFPLHFLASDLAHPHCMFHPQPHCFVGQW